MASGHFSHKQTRQWVPLWLSIEQFVDTIRIYN
jgi:hypothetical protein